ncbi:MULTISPECIES: LacI family DNA-binding transcriptional regulator [Vibrio]|uniref:LacI family transcriptional regulator n=3 Tax=Vibrio TaxID=662 RepID=A0A0A5HWW7_PHOS4|nr:MULTISPECIES: LacI family DNA-binding transcriptional regulator [Vibrio]EED28534.1 transcriptional regulator [Vibrio sp. 16]KGY10042.1 LacI family transcriptional regulator [Vibrio sinaloensis]KHA61950.1 LacI family transcriptional regulator [Vibrio variabilis]KHD25978.1 LacI family transcriptional regulator [Vibrio caribbeanicus]KHT47044.1 LacI family transcriptional regulator [Vibrio sinaloensis]
MITIKEVAELAKVSQATVSRAINNHPTVKEANRKKVFAAIEQLGYKPNAFAQALASSRSNSIGMLVGSLDGPFYGPLMHHTEDTIRRNNNHLIVTSGQESHTKERESIEFLRSKRVDGFILHSDKLSDDELIEVVKETPATIILNRFIPDIADNCIFIDNELGGYLATKHLLDKGHQKIACITGQLSKGDSRDRLQGYRLALAEAGITYNPSYVIEGRFDHDGNHERTRRLLDRAPDITAVFCQNDNIALAVYDVAAERNITIGKDLSVVGFDNDYHSAHIRPRLTTVNFPVEEMGREAARGVLAIVQDNPANMKKQLQPELIVRDSVGTL